MADNDTTTNRPSPKKKAIIWTIVFMGIALVFPLIILLPILLVQKDVFTIRLERFTDDRCSEQNMFGERTVVRAGECKSW